MKKAFLLFFVIVIFSTLAKAQQTFNSLNVKDLDVTKKLRVISTSFASKPCPAMTLTQRNALTANIGECVYNTTESKINAYDGTTWKSVGGGIEDWITSKAYVVGDVVIESTNIYQCNTAHTSSVFATDIANWTRLANSLTGVTGVLPLTNGGTNKNITASAGAVTYSDSDSFELTSVGTSGQVLQSNGTSAPTFVNKSISAKAGSNSSVTTEEIQVMNNLITQTATNKQLIDLNNKNVLSNSSFEHSTPTTSWTVSGSATQTTETTNVIDGTNSLKFVTTGNSFTVLQDSTLYASQFADGVSCIVKARVKNTAAGVTICPRVAGSSLSGQCLTAATDGKWALYKIAFTCGATSQGIQVGSGTTAGTTYVDDMFVGAADLTDANLTTYVTSIGATSPDIQGVFFGSGSDCSSSCTTGTCTICDQIGNKITSVTWNATGQYRINGIDGTKYNCVGNGSLSGNFGMALFNRPASTSSYAVIQFGYNSSGATGGTNTNAGFAAVNCLGK